MSKIKNLVEKWRQKKKKIVLTFREKEQCQKFEKTKHHRKTRKNSGKNKVKIFVK